MIIEILKEGVQGPRRNGKFYKVGQRVIVDQEFGKSVIDNKCAVQVQSTSDSFFEKAKQDAIEQGKKRIKELKKQKLIKKE